MTPLPNLVFWSHAFYEGTNCVLFCIRLITLRNEHVVTRTFIHLRYRELSTLSTAAMYTDHLPNANPSHLFFRNSCNACMFALIMLVHHIHSSILILPRLIRRRHEHSNRHYSWRSHI